MSNYKHKSGLTAKKQSCGTFDVYNVDGDVVFKAIPESWFNRSPDFGWEKVEEPFKEREWYFWINKKYEILLRASGSHTEYSVGYTEMYMLLDGEFVKEGKQDWCDLKYVQGPATPDQIERILSVVARHKGYKEFVRIDSIVYKMPVDVSRLVYGAEKELMYRETEDTLYLWGYSIYSKGTWAKIVEEPKAAEPEVEAGHEYLCIKDKEDDDYRLTFTKGKRYLFEKSEGWMWTKNDQGNTHRFKEAMMFEYFDMGTDWKTAKVFTYKDLMVMYTKTVLEWEEEAKKRTNA